MSLQECLLAALTRHARTRMASEVVAEVDGRLRVEGAQMASPPSPPHASPGATADRIDYRRDGAGGRSGPADAGALGVLQAPQILTAEVASAFRSTVRRGELEGGKRDSASGS